MRSTWLVCCALSAAAWPAGGCGSDTFQTESRAGMDIEDVPAEYARMLCAQLLRCAPVFEFVIGSLEACAGELEEQVRQGWFDGVLEAVEEGRTRYDGSEALACQAAYDELPCAELHVEPEPCQAVFQGSVPRGGECVLDQECEGDSICAFEGACPGECTARLAAGGVCDGSDERCASGLVCSEATNRCVAPGEQGDPCGGGVDAQCVAGLFCVGEDEAMGVAGTCLPMDEVFVGEEGDPCNFEDGGMCKPGLSCVAEGSLSDLQFVCRALRDDGACAAGFPTHCPTGQYCSGIALALDDLEGTCTDMPRANEPCGDAGLFAEVCARGHLCVDGTCRALRDNGQSCASNEECYSGYCADGGCAPSNVCE